jgi:hypothetical protein
MSFFAVIFAATDPELERAFPGWRRPLAHPVKVTFVNPFTKALRTVDSWNPAHVGRTTPWTVGEKEDWLPFKLGKLPQVAMKNLFDDQIDSIFEILAGEQQPKPEVALYGGGEMVKALSPTAIPLLASLTDADLPRQGKVLSDDGDFFLNHGWTEKICARVLGELRALAKNAQTTGRALYLCSE